MTAQETAAAREESPSLVERSGRVVTLTPNRPHRRNAMSTAMPHQLASELRQLTERDGEVPGALVLTGAGGTFSSGADTREPDWRGLSRRAVRRAHFRAVFSALHEAPFPRWRPSRGTRSGAGSNSPWPATWWWPAKARCSGFRSRGVGAVLGGGALAEARALAASVAEKNPVLLEAGVRLLRDSGHLDRTAALGVENGYGWQAAAAANHPDRHVSGHEG